MYTSELPDAVQKAWGSEAAKDFVAWLDEYLHEARFAPEIQVSAFVARQKVNVLMLERVSNLLLAGEPRLVQMSGGHWVWQVPVDFTLPSHGRVGCVGELDVDARYGEMRYTDALLAQIADKARCLAEQVLLTCSCAHTEILKGRIYKDRPHPARSFCVDSSSLVGST